MSGYVSKITEKMKSYGLTTLIQVGMALCLDPEPYYAEMKELAQEVRSDYGFATPRVRRSDLRKIYRAEGIHIRPQARPCRGFARGVFQRRIWSGCDGDEGVTGRSHHLHDGPRIEASSRRLESGDPLPMEIRRSEPD